MTTLFLLLFAGVVVTTGWLLSRKWAINPTYFYLSFGILVVIGFLVNHPDSPFLMKSDGLYYEKQAVEVSTWLRNGMQGKLQLDKLKEAWPFFLGSIYFLVGREPFIGILVNSSLIAIALILVIRAAQLMFNRTPALPITILVLLSPMVLTMGPSLGRESVFWLGSTLLLLSGIYLLKKTWKPGISTFIAGAALLLLIRPNLGLVLIYAFLIPVSVLVLIQSNLSKSYKLFSSCFVTLILIVSIPLSFSPFNSSIENVSITRADLSKTASSGFSVELPEDANPDGNSEEGSFSKIPQESSKTETNLPQTNLSPLFTKLVYNVNVGIVTIPRIIAGPFLNELSFTPLWLYLSGSTFIWLLIFVTAITQMLMSGRKYFKYALFQLIMVLAFVAVLAVMLTNYGIIARFRIPVELLLVPWAAIFLQNFRTSIWRRKNIRSGQFEI